MNFNSIQNTIKKWMAKAENKLPMLSLPTPKEIDSEEILEFTKRFKGKSQKETITNILEWQDRNIEFWWDRWIGNLSVSGIICNALLLLLLSFLSVYILLLPNIDGFAFRVILDILSGLKFISIVIGIAIIIFLICYLFLLRFTLYSGMGWKAVHYIYYTLFPKLPVNKILEYKLALCRDYTRLTASLLFNLYPNNKVYFIKTTWHETVGLRLKDEIYVLDQHLPIKTIDDDKYANADIYIAKRNSNGNITLEQQQWKWTKNTHSKINTEELTDEVVKMLKIKQNSSKDEPDLKIPLEKCVKNHYNALIRFSSDEIIQYSLIRSIKNRFENEFYGRIDKISKIKIKQDEDDLIIEVYYAPL
jgi:predicted transglutaminase-like protease